jgi:hypothetical protein
MGDLCAGEFDLTSIAPASGLRRLKPCHHPFLDKPSLLCDGADDVKDHFACWCGGVETLGERAEAHATLA